MAIPDDGVVFAYIDKHGILRATEYADRASHYGNGVFLVTDEIKANEGKTEVNGEVYEIFGAGDIYVYESKQRVDKTHTTSSNKN